MFFCRNRDLDPKFLQDSLCITYINQGFWVLKRTQFALQQIKALKILEFIRRWHYMFQYKHLKIPKSGKIKQKEVGLFKTRTKYL